MHRPPVTHPRATERDWWWIFDPRLSLRARAALITGVSALAFTLLASALAGTLVRRSLERQLGANFETLAFQLADKLDRVILARQRELQLAASLAPMRSTGTPPAERRKQLELVQDNSRDFAWLGFADAGGTLRAATGGVFEGTPAGSRPWFLVARERNYAAGPAELPALTNELTPGGDARAARYLDLAVPVQSAEGPLLGVLGAHLHWDWTREVQFSVVPETARREQIGVTVYSATGDVLLDSGASGWSQPPEPPAISDARKFRGTLLETTAAGTSYVSGFARSRGYREYRGLGWLIVVRQPADLALAPARELQATLFGWGVVLSAALVIVSWISAGRISRRLRGMTLAAQRIRDGDVLSILPRPQGDGELARMCGSVGDLVEDLREKARARDESPK
ncbi:MAG: cache and HAMP domain-containing protein [Opitutaceae bacterium]